MSEFSERIVKQTEALLHFQHDETLQETTPERLHEALGQVIMMEISANWTKTKRRQAPGRRAFYFFCGVSCWASGLQQSLQSWHFCVK